MTHDELVEEYCESNGYEICPLADSPDQICRNPNHCEQCEAEYAEWLDSKEKKIAELAGQLDWGDIPGNYDKCKLVDSIAEQVINFGYRKADEVRKETAREVIKPYQYERFGKNGQTYSLKCGRCNKTVQTKWNYCPFCGAKLREEEE